MILDLYRLGSLHVTDTGCALVMQTNIQYWAIDELLIESCCSLKYYPQLDVCQNEKSGDIEAKKMTEEKMKEENFGTSKFGRFRSWLWDTIGKGKVKTHREDCMDTLLYFLMDRLTMFLYAYLEYPWTSSTAQLLGRILYVVIR